MAQERKRGARERPGTGISRFFSAASWHWIIVLGVLAVLIYWPLEAVLHARTFHVPFRYILWVEAPSLLAVRVGISAFLLGIAWGAHYLLSRQQHIEQALQYRLRLEEMVTALSAHFVKALPFEIDAEIAGALQHIVEFVQIDRAYVGLYGQDGKTIVTIYEWGIPDLPPQADKVTGLSMEPFQWLNGYLLRGEALRIPDVAALPLEAAAERQIWQALGIRSVAVIPLQLGSALVGFLGLNAERQLRAWTAEDARLLQLVSEILVNALGRKRAEEALQKHAAQLETLRQVGLEITAQLDADALLSSLISQTIRLMGLQVGMLYLYRPDRDVLELAISVGEGMAPKGVVLHRGEGLSGKVWERGEPMLIEDYPHWEGRATIFGSYPWDSILAVPVRWGETFLGILGVAANLPRKLTMADVELLSLFATQAAIALRNAQLVRSLADSEDRYRTISGLTSDYAYAFRVQPDGSIQAEWLSDACQEIIGSLDPDVFARWYWLSRNHPEDIALIQEHLNILLSGKTHVAEYRVLNRLGEERWLRDHGYPLWDEEQGRVVRIIGAAQDITASRWAEESLRHRLAMEELVASLSARFMSATPEQVDAEIERAVQQVGELVRVDRAYVTLFSKDGLKIERLYQWRSRPDVQKSGVQGIALAPFSWSLDRLRRLEPLDVPSVAQLPPEARAEQSIWEAQGVKSLIAIPLALGSQLLGFFGFANDDERTCWPEEDIRFLQLVGDLLVSVLARQQMESALRLQAELLNSVREALIATDARGRVTYWGKGAEALYGYTADEVMGRFIRMISVLDDETERMQLVQAHRTGLWSGETQRRRKDGGILWVENVFSLTRDAAGHPVGYIGIDRDISERKRAEDALKRYAERLGVLHEIDQTILAVQSPEQIAEAALNRIRKLISCRRASIMLFDLSNHTLTILAASIVGESQLPKGTVLPLSEMPYLDALMRGELVAIPDLRQYPDPSASVQILIKEGLRSYIFAPLVIQGEVIGCLNISAETVGAFDQESAEIASEVARTQAVALQQARLAQQLQEERERLQALSSRLIEVQEEERRHLARELHDQIGQMLTGLKLMLQMSCNEDDEATRRAKLSGAASLLDELIAQVRELSVSLRPTMLDDLGLLPTLHWHFERYTAQTQIRVIFDHALPRRMQLASEIEIAAYRMIQEALTNVARHAGVNEVQVRLWTEKGALHIMVRDRGAGFDPQRPRPTGKASGLSGMQERVMLLGGHLTIESARGMGTTLTAKLPLLVKTSPQERIKPPSAAAIG